MRVLTLPCVSALRLRRVVIRLATLGVAALLLVVVASGSGLPGGCNAAGPAHGAWPVPVQQPQEVYRLPHTPGAFTQGLFFAQGRLFETTGRYGQSRLMELDPHTGQVLRTRYLPAQHFGEGSVAVGKRIIWLTWTGEQAFVFDLDTFEPLGEFHYQGEGWGLAFDGERLLMSDGGSGLVFRDPQTFEPLGSVRVTDGGVAVDQLNELEWAGGLVYANVWHEPRIAVIDPYTGAVVSWLNLDFLAPTMADPSAVLNGIAFDERNDCLLVTGKLWPEMICVRPVR